MFFTNTFLVRPLEYQYMTTDALFGIPAQVSATCVVLFVIFGALAERMGVGKLFMDFALALTGRRAGGPAKVAVVTSGLFGSVPGSAVANVMTTGAFAIPLMKRIGYPAPFAGAVESVASTGGRIMPPILGAAALVMAGFLGVGYLTVVAYAILPALLYYLAVFLAVHFEARKQGLKGSVEGGPAARRRGAAEARAPLPAARHRHRHADVGLLRALFGADGHPVGRARGADAARPRAPSSASPG